MLFDAVQKLIEEVAAVGEKDLTVVVGPKTMHAYNIATFSRVNTPAALNVPENFSFKMVLSIPPEPVEVEVSDLEGK